MGLSNETAQNTATLDAYGNVLAEVRARKLGSVLVRGERNEHPERNAANPAYGVRVRVIRPERSRVTVDEECKAHNSSAANLGASEEWGALWR